MSRDYRIPIIHYLPRWLSNNTGALKNILFQIQSQFYDDKKICVFYNYHGNHKNN